MSYDSISITDLNNLTKSTSLEFDLESTQQIAKDHFKDFVRNEDLFVKDYQDLRGVQSLHSLIVNEKAVPYQQIPKRNTNPNVKYTRKSLKMILLS